MNLFRMAYNGIGSGLLFALFPPFFIYSKMSGRFRKETLERLGLYPECLCRPRTGPPRIWIHAASVGEAGVALSIAQALDTWVPGCTLILSTITGHGRRYAEKRLRETALGTRTHCVFAPMDLVLTTRRALAALRPDVLACVETELWPNWLMEAHRMGIKTALVNGRISVRSIGKYLKIRPLMAPALARVDAFSMIRNADARRIAMMGAPAHRILVHGNTKFDLPVPLLPASEKARMRDLYGASGAVSVFIAGSTRGDEDAMILGAFGQILEKHPETVLILAPRHIEKAPHIVHLARAGGFSVQRKTELAGERSRRRAQVVILDTIGELQRLYAIADVVFCGGSLVPTGGQNVLEAAVWGKPVLYGPSMEDFLDAKEILDQAGGGIQVKDAGELAEKALFLLKHPEKARAMGHRARRALAANRGAAKRHAGVIRGLLNGTTP